VFDKLAVVERERWNCTNDEGEDPTFTAAIRELETAALIARYPRSVVTAYVGLARRARWRLDAMAQDWHSEADDTPRLTCEQDAVVSDAAELVIKAAWASSATRWMWLGRRLRRLEREVAALPGGRMSFGLTEASGLRRALIALRL
jgi:hypothetical protein